MKLGYFDPPYPDQAVRHYSHDPSGIPAEEVDHYELLTELRDHFDGWALSTSVPASISVVVPIINELFPKGFVREGAWVKPFASFKPTLNVQYTWEPVFFVSGRPKGSKEIQSVRDFIITEPEAITDVVVANITMRKGTHGAKPDKFNDWILDILRYNPQEDTFEDRYPGTGSMAKAIERRNVKAIEECPDREHPGDTSPSFNLCKNSENKTGSCMCNWILDNGKCPRRYQRCQSR